MVRAILTRKELKEGFPGFNKGIEKARARAMETPKPTSFSGPDYPFCK